MFYVIIVIVVFYIIQFFVSVFNSEKKLYKLYKKYVNIPNSKNLHGKDIAFLGKNVLGLDSLKIAYRSGILTDAYSYGKKILIMSEEVCETNSVAAAGIVAHELGHAVQHKNKSFLFRVCRFLRWFCNIFTRFALPLVCVGGVMYLCNFYVNIAEILIIISIVLFGINILYNLLEIPLESNASEIGFAFLKDYEIVGNKDSKKVKKLMAVAGKTYMKDFFRQLNPFRRF